MRSRVESIDALRGGFALLVLTFHCSQWLELPLDYWLMSTLRIWGVYAVEGFFVISGMALYLSMKEGQFSKLVGVRKFFVHRYARILPLYGLLFFIHPSSTHFSSQRLIEMMMLFGFLKPESSMLVGGWSIGVEFVFYFIFPLLALLVRDRVGMALLMSALAFLALFGWSILFDLSPPFYSQNPLYVTPFNHFAFFVSGYLLGVIYRRSIPVLLWLQSCRYNLILAIGVFVFMCLVGSNEHQIQVMGGYRRLLLSMLLVTLVGLIASMNLNGSIARFLGDISYALYLIHPFVVFGLLPFIGIDNHWLNLVIVYGVTIPMAFLSHRYFEMPAQKYIRRIGNA